MKDKYDVIIIGAGIGGLVCGTYLAKHGMKVLIVERNKKVGGCCSSFERDGFKFDAGTHIFTEMGKNGIAQYVLNKIGLRYEFKKAIPTDRFHLGKEILKIPNGIDQFILYLRKKFPSEETNLKAFFKYAIKIYKNFGKPNKIDLETTYDELLEKFFKTQELKNLLSVYSGFIGARAQESSASIFASVLISIVEKGCYYPIGGAQSFVDALAKLFRSHGGEISLNSECTALIVNKEKKAVKELVINNKKHLDSQLYISNGDITNLFNHLVKPNIFDNKDILGRFETSFSLYGLYVGCDLEPKELENKVGWHFEGSEITEQNPFYLACPSVFDSALAPAKKSAIICFRFAPNNIVMNPDESYKKKNQQISLDKLIRVLPAIKGRIKVLESATPQSITRFTLNRQGAAYGWKPKPNQLFRNVKYDLPKNLFVVGHWSGGGGGAAPVIISGFNIAQLISKRTIK